MKRNGIALLFMVGLVFPGCGGKKEPQPVKAVVYYINWDLNSETPLSCDELKNSETSFTIDNPDEINGIMQAIKVVKLVELADVERIDTRVCCVFYDKNDKALKTVSFSNTGQMQIDSGIYETDNDLLDMFMEYLPDGYMAVPDTTEVDTTIVE